MALDATPRCLARIPILVVTLGLALLATACTSDGSSSDPAPTPAPSATADSSASRPPLNDLERKIVNALAELGIEASPAELNPDSASIGAQFENGSELFVSGVRGGADGSFTVMSERRIGGVMVRKVEYATADAVRDRFDCDGVTYEAQGDAPPGFTKFDTFLARFIAELGCR